MCLKRDNDDSCDKLLYQFPILDTIDLTIDELGDDDDFVEITPPVDQWNYPYNLLPSSDEEEPVIIRYMLQHNTAFWYSPSKTREIHSRYTSTFHNKVHLVFVVNLMLNITAEVYSYLSSSFWQILIILDLWHILFCHHNT